MSGDNQVSILTSVASRWPIIVFFGLLGLGLAGGAAALLPPSWTGSASVVYTGPTTDALTEAASNSGDLGRTIASETLVAHSDAVLSRAAKSLKMSQNDLEKASTVTNPTGSNILVFQVTATSARIAVRQADTLAAAYLSYSKEQLQDAFKAQASALDSDLQRLTQQLAQRRLATDVRQALQTTYSSTYQRQVLLRAASTAEQGPGQSLSTGNPPPTPSTPGVLTSAVAGFGLGTVVGALLLAFLSTAYPRRWARTRDRR